ncbi:UNVERIFIED_CONTAM: hypothetical protein FKN15_008915 [Acipenser sinensis]
MKLSRQFTVFGSAIFCVVVFSLYLMLDHLQLDHTKNPKGAGSLLQKGQLSILQEKIDHLERLLSENNEIISNIRDSVINLSESVKDGKGNPEAMNLSRGAFSELLVSPPLVIPVDAEDCQFAAKSYSKASDDVQTNLKQEIGHARDTSRSAPRMHIGPQKTVQYPVQPCTAIGESKKSDWTSTSAVHTVFSLLKVSAAVNPRSGSHS